MCSCAVRRSLRTTVRTAVAGAVHAAWASPSRSHCARFLLQIFCNGVEVMSCGGTKESYVVDVWSGNHPYYQGAKSTIVLDDGRVSRFNKQFADLADTFGNVETANSVNPDAVVKAGPKQARGTKKR